MATEITGERRIAIEERQREAAAGADLLKLLCAMTADGKIQLSEVQQLRDWLFTHVGADLPAITALTKLVVGILKDGAISESEATELYLAIEKVLPLSEREHAKQAREDSELAAEEEIQEKQSIPGDRLTQEGLGRMNVPGGTNEEVRAKPVPRGDWRGDPLTEAQGHYIKALGGAINVGATKGEAAVVIEQLLRKRPLSSRQIMVLRFWGKDTNLEDGPRQISAWMDQFYAEDSDRKAAWELFKQESEDNGLQGDPARVPIGVGSQYLTRVKRGGSQAVPRSRAQVGQGTRAPARTGVAPGVRLAFWAVGAGAVVLIIYLVARPTPKAAVPARITIQASPAVSAPQAIVPAVTVEGPTSSEVSKAELKAYAASMHFTGIFLVAGQGVAMIDGQRVKLGQKLGPGGAYTLATVDGVERLITLRDQFGNTVIRKVK